MSLSNPSNSIPNPSEKYIYWHGKKAYLYYWDNDKKEDVKLAIPFRMIVLDQVSCVAGFHKPSKTNIWSNEVRNPKTDKMFVKTYKGGFSWEGIYKDIISKIPGGRFFKSIYVAIRLQGYDDFIIANLKLKGSSQWAWSEFCKKNKEHIEKVGAVSINGFSNEGDGDTAHVIPLFQIEQISQQSTTDQAIELDKKLQSYLKYALGRNTASEASPEDYSGEHEEEIPDDAYTTTGPPEIVDDLPF